MPSSTAREDSIPAIELEKAWRESFDSQFIAEEEFQGRLTYI
jgi:hypothetical protein